MIQLFIGGVRSGKSEAAENLLIDQLRNEPSLQPAYVATSVAIGNETKLRIQRHQQDRQSRFNQPLPTNKLVTYELDYQQADLLSTLTCLDTPQHIVLIECLSTWVGWYLSAEHSLQKNLDILEAKQAALLLFLAQAKCRVVIVTGEVGCGLIGETPLQRRYADALGELNQQVAKLSKQVFLVTAGIKQQLK